MVFIHVKGTHIQNAANRYKIGNLYKSIIDSTPSRPPSASEALAKEARSPSAAYPEPPAVFN